MSLLMHCVLDVTCHLKSLQVQRPPLDPLLAYEDETHWAGQGDGNSMGAGFPVLLLFGPKIHGVIVGVCEEIVPDHQTSEPTQGGSLGEKGVSIPAQECLDLQLSQVCQNPAWVGSQELLVSHGDHCCITAQPVSHQAADVLLPARHPVICGAICAAMPTLLMQKSGKEGLKFSGKEILCFNLGLRRAGSARHTISPSLPFHE